MNQLIVVCVILLKFLVPLSFFLFPFVGSWSNYVLDIVDGDILRHFGLSEYTYQTVDKIADYVTYIFMFLVGRKWPIGKVITILFVVRTVGQVAFFITRNELVFFLFPNFLEPLFMIYALMLFKYKDLAYEKYQKHFKLIWIIVIGYKMINEWQIHIANIDLSTIFFGFNN